MHKGSQQFNPAPRPRGRKWGAEYAIERDEWRIAVRNQHGYATKLLPLKSTRDDAAKAYREVRAALRNT
jgi:hypothetical protein